jgi:heavy metal sensor kinase
MFFERINNFRRSLAFRLTLLYSAMFAISSLLVFVAFYGVMVSKIHTRTDNFLSAKMKEFSSLLATRGMEAIRDEMIVEAESVGTNDLFFRLLTSEGNEIASSNLKEWQKVGTSRGALKHVSEGPVFESLNPPSWRHQVRVLYGLVGPGTILQIGQSLRDDEHFFETMRELFSTLIAIVFPLAALGGWLMARRSLSGVQKLTQTAMAIYEGTMDKRVPLTGRSDEIDRLSGIFNRMLDRIQSLITEIKEVTDNIAHDIKSPITRIMGLAEVTLTTARSLDDYQTGMANTVEECDRLLKMINTMLEISEAEAGVTSLNLSEVDVPVLIEEACDLFEPLAEEKGLSMEVNVPQQCFLFCDKERLQQVIANLLDNAIKYTSSGKIIVSAEKVNGKVIISIRDTGIGMPSSEIPRIFDRFYRADKSRSVAGSGLGLSLVRAIVQKHGGEINITSSPGMGSTFAVVLPQTSIR